MNVTIETKVCKKCGEDKPLSDFHKDKSKKDGHRNDCKACVLAARKAYRETNSEKIRAEKNAWYAANREEIREYRKNRYYSRREEAVAASRKWYEENRDEDLARRRARKADRYANDPVYRAKVNASNLLRNRLQPGAKQEPYTREEIFARDNWICGLCEEPIDSELKWPERGSASIDHVIPLSLGGDDTPANVQAAHFGCNSAKGNRVELELEEAA